MTTLLFAMVDAVLAERVTKAHEVASFNARHGMVSMADTNRIRRHMNLLGWWRLTWPGVISECSTVSHAAPMQRRDT